MSPAPPSIEKLRLLADEIQAAIEENYAYIQTKSSFESDTELDECIDRLALLMKCVNYGSISWMDKTQRRLVMMKMYGAEPTTTPPDA